MHAPAGLVEIGGEHYNSAYGDCNCPIPLPSTFRRENGKPRGITTMSIPLRQALLVGTYVLKQRLQGRKRFPVVLMLEPLFRCNLACAGCGKIQHPTAILRQNLSPEDCFHAVEECGAPVVSIAGG